MPRKALSAAAMLGPCHAGGHPEPRHVNERGAAMSTWLLIIIVGVVLLILGFAGVGEFLIWIGVAVLVIGLILNLTSRGRGTRV
jgi:hypothetical protein